MKLDEALKASVKTTPVSDHAVAFIHGSIETDSDSRYFRLYRHPENRRSYLLIKKDDVAGELHKWSPEEMSHAGFVGSSIHSVPLNIGTQIHAVSVRAHRFGEPINVPSKSSSAEQVCCCSASCSDTGSCFTTSAENCAQFGIVCPGSC